MKKIFYLILFISYVSCISGNSKKSKILMINQTDLTNKNIHDYSFLDCMYVDKYFPKFLVDKCKAILLDLCLEIETKKPNGLVELYKLSHSATNKINNLENEFFKNGSEIETGARECLAIDFEFIAESYGFNADIEDLIATRNW